MKQQVFPVIGASCKAAADCVDRGECHLRRIVRRMSMFQNDVLDPSV